MRMIKRWKYVCLIFLCFAGMALGKEQAFCNPVLSLLDENCHTYIFRGKLPQHDDKFSYDELTGQFNVYLSQSGAKLSPDYYLLCISLLNCTDAKERKIEYDWFRDNPDKGCLWSYPLFGSLINPSYMAPGLRVLFLRFDPDGIRSLIGQIRGLIEGSGNTERDVVIYVHCRAGKDRTGEAAACYMMQYQGYSYQQAVIFCRQIAGRKLRGPSVNAMRWHAYYLRDICHFPTIGCID